MMNKINFRMMLMIMLTLSVAVTSDAKGKTEIIDGISFPAGTGNQFDNGCQAAIDYFAAAPLYVSSQTVLNQFNVMGINSKDVKQYCRNKTARVFATWYDIYSKNDGKIPNFSGEPNQTELNKNFACLNKNMQNLRFAGFLTGFRLYMGAYFARKNANPEKYLDFLRSDAYQWEMFMVCTNAEKVIAENSLPFMK